MWEVCVRVSISLLEKWSYRPLQAAFFLTSKTQTVYIIHMNQ